MLHPSSRLSVYIAVASLAVNCSTHTHTKEKKTVLKLTLFSPDILLQTERFWYLQLQGNVGSGKTNLHQMAEAKEIL